MSGSRANVGIGNLTRPTGLGPAELPYVGGGTSGTRLPIFRSDYTVSTKEDCLHHLTKRVGAGIELSINRNRNQNILTDIGFREPTIGTTGIYDVTFSLSGVFVPEYSDWIQYGILSQPIKITSASTFALASGSTTTGYVTTGGVTFTTPILQTDFTDYKATATATTGMEIHIYTYVNLDGPRYFDLGYVQVNETTTFGSYNEMGVLCGCIIDSFTISYESGSDMAIKFSIDGIAISEWFGPTSEAFDYNAILQDVPANVLVTGCLSINNNDGNGYVAVAETDSASVTVSNSVEKRGNCLKLYGSAYSLGGQSVEISTSTYSNNPNKYLSYMYGITAFPDLNPAGSPTSTEPFTLAKTLKPIPYIKIRSDDSTQRAGSVASMFLDMDFTKVWVGTSNRSYSVDSAIMEEPDLRASKVRLAVGFVPSS